MRTHFSRSPRSIPLEDRDYPEWRRGRERYGVWMIDADTAPLRERVALARAELGDLLTDHQRSPHITLFVCGFLVASAVRIDPFDDDFDDTMRSRQRQAVQAAALPAFSLEIGGINSFDSAVFLEVRDGDGALRKLRAALRRGQPEICPGRYTPHLTVGLYRDAFAKRELRRRLAPLAALPPLRLDVRQIVFAAYDACSLDGPFTILDRLPLASKG